MVKIIQPRRTNKNVSSEQYWQIRDAHRQNAFLSVPHHYKEQQVRTRHRFNKSTQQAKQFKPLAIFLQKQIQRNDYIQHYLQQMQNQLPAQLNPAKKLMFTLPLVLYSLQNIFNILCQNLHTPQTWNLLQAVLKDTKTESYQYFMNSLKKMIGCYTSTSFQLAYFRNFFDTWCIFMQTNFNKITESVDEFTKFFKQVRAIMLQHANKYFRKFAQQTLSYILGNLSQEFYGNFLKQILDDEQQDYWVACTVLYERNPPFQGTMTPSQLELLTSSIKQLAKYQSSQYTKVIIFNQFLSRILVNLDIKGGENQNIILFDLRDILKVLISLSKQNLFGYQVIIYALTELFKVKYANNRQFRTWSSFEDIIVNFLKEAVQNLQTNSSSVYSLLGSFINNQALILNKNIINFLQKSNAEQIIIFFDSFRVEPSVKVVEGLVLCCRKLFNTYLLDANNSRNKALLLILYRLIIMMKKAGLNHRIVLSSIEITHENIIKKLSLFLDHNPNSYETIVLFRILSQFSLAQSAQLQEILLKIYSKVIKNYQSYLDTQLQMYNPEAGIFSKQRHILNLYMLAQQNNSRQLRQGLNLLQAFITLINNLQPKKYSIKSLKLQKWADYFVDRVSLIQLFQNQKPKLKLLKSRHRQLRYNILKQLKNQEINQLSIFNFYTNTLAEIDEQDINLDNERDIKLKLQLISRKIAKENINQYEAQILFNWSLGFAYTGFKLINQVFIDFFSGFLQHALPQFPSIKVALMEYLQCYAYRNSRIFDSEKQQKIESEQQELKNLIKVDMQIGELQTIQWIGLDRICQAIRISEKIKVSLGSRLMQLLQSYFEQQFNRPKNNLLKALSGQIQQNDFNQSLLKPPKIKFLQVILKVAPANYKPPVQCLHLTQQYLKVPSIEKIKKSKWQVFWGKDRKMKQQTNSVQFSLMAPQEKQLYIHFMWQQILKANSSRRRILIEHIRQKLPNQVQLLFNIFVNSKNGLLAQSEEKMLKCLNLFDNKVLLSQLFILKSLLTLLRNFVDQSFLQISMKFLYVLAKKLLTTSRKSIEGQQQQEQDNQQHQQQQIEENIKQQQKGKYSQQKQLRKELYKVLEVTFQTYRNTIPQKQYEQIILLFEGSNKFSALSYAAESSIPGLLKIIEAISKFNYQILIRKSIMEGLAQIWTKNTKQQCTRINSRVMLRILGFQPQEYQMIQHRMDQQKNHQQIQPFAQLLLMSMKTNFNKFARNIDFLKIISELFSICSDKCNLQGWDEALWKQLSGIVNINRNLKKKEIEILTILFKASVNFSKKWKAINLLQKMITLTPYLIQPQLKQQLNVVIYANSQILNFRASTLQISTKINKFNKKGLQTIIDFSSYFEGLKQYTQLTEPLTNLQHQFIIYNFLGHNKVQELSVRKGISTALKRYLSEVEDLPSIRKIYRLILDILRKSTSQNENLFWASLLNIGHCLRKLLHFTEFQDFLLKDVIAEEQSEKDMFHMLSALSQSHKLKGLKMLKDLLIKEQSVNINVNKYPNPITTILLPILCHMMFPVPNQRGDQIQGNLTSTLILVSLQLYNLCVKKLPFSQQKQELKRLVSKIKFDETHNKKNVMLVRVIGQIIEAIKLPNSTQLIRKQIKQQGFQKFNKKLHQKHPVQLQEEPEQVPKQIHQQLLVEDQQILNKNLLLLQKRMMEGQQQNQQQNQITRFLRKNVLAPLKAMLFFENRSKQQNKEQDDKSRMLLSVAVTKIIVKFPVSIFLSQFQKVMTKLARLLKKRQVQVRNSARKCLLQIIKVTGPEMLYLLIRQIKFHLRDNFQGHVFNYTIWHILNELTDIQIGSLDYCLPLILPVAVDQIFGKSRMQKEMVDQGKIPTLIMQAKKKKGHDLVILLAKKLSPHKIQYLINYFSKTLREYLNTQSNIARYEQLVVSILAGLTKNQQFLKQQNSKNYLQLISTSIKQLLPQIRFYSFGKQTLQHESQVKQQTRKQKKKTKGQILIIQQEAARNKSIFTKITKQIAQKRNSQIISNCMIQFHLALTGMLLKKRIFDEKSVLVGQQEFNVIINFVFECLDHKDNGLVIKSLRILHPVLSWKLDAIQKLRKKVGRKVLAFMDKLTAGDGQLLKQCFGILIDLFSQIDITQPIGQQLLLLLKVHITGQSIQTGLIQPYKLLKLLVYKKVKINLSSLYEFVRVQLINTHDEDIRDLAKNICGSYLRAYVEGQQRKNHLIFYLSNLDCKLNEAQNSILDLLRQFVSNSTVKEIQQYGQVILMGLATAYANGNQNRQTLHKISVIILKNINHSKIQSLLQKCTLWIDKKNQHLIRTCGYYLIDIIIEQKIIKFGEELRQILRSQLTSVIISQAEELKQYFQDIQERNLQKRVLKDQKQWRKLIMDNDGDAQFKVHPWLQLVFQIAIKIHQNYSIKLWQKEQVISSIFYLLKCPVQSVYQSVVKTIQQQKDVLSLIGLQKLISQNQEDQNRFYWNKILRSIIGNQHNAINLLHHLFIEAAKKQIFEFFEINLVASTQIISQQMKNVKKNESKLSLIYEILELTLTYTGDIIQKVFTKKDNIRNLVWQIGKVSRNQLTPTQILQKNQRIAQIVKKWMGTAEYYKLLSQLEQQRKQTKQKNKADLAQLAVTNQQLYQQIKSGKKRKL